MRKFLLAAIALMLLATSVTLWSTREAASPQEAGTITTQSPPAIGGGFTLTNQHGAPVQESDFRGKLMLVFFGFTNCPDICPVTTKNLSDLMGQLGTQADQVAPVFISVDPERDTPAVMKNYFANFDSRLIGLTGTPEQVKQAASAYKVYYAKAQPEDEQAEQQKEAANEEATPAEEMQQPEEDPQAEAPEQPDHANHAGHGGHEGHAGHAAHGGADYLVDHSGYIYLMDRSGVYVRHFPYDATPAELAAAVKLLLN
jgi:cytochrome oxidase Cu insertion factor (SCO1/SenC/PrrC family)